MKKLKQSLKKHLKEDIKDQKKGIKEDINKGKEMNWREEVALLAFTAVGVLLSILLGLLIFGGF